MPTYTSLRAFEAVVRLGTVRAAAAELHVTQSAVSHLLRDLESALGVAVLERKGRNIAPTHRGERLAAALHKGFSTVQAGVDEVNHKIRGTRLTLACLPSVAARWLIQRLPGFRQARPDIQLHIQYTRNASHERPDHDADVEICSIDGLVRTDSSLYRLFDGSTYPVCSPLYMDRFGGIRTLADLINVELLHDESTGSWKNWFKKCGLVNPAIEQAPVFEDFNLMSIAVLAGHGVALAPMILINPELESGTLVRLFDSAANQDRSYYIKLNKHSPEIDAFVKWVFNPINGVLRQAGVSAEGFNSVL